MRPLTERSAPIQDCQYVLLLYEGHSNQQGEQSLNVLCFHLNPWRLQSYFLLKPPKNRLPSYSTVRRALLHINYEQYSICLAQFFNVQPHSGETIGLDGKVLKGSYQIENDNPNSDSHPAIMLVSSYIVERGLILEPFEVDAKTNEIKAFEQINKGHGRIKKRHVSICQNLDCSRWIFHGEPMHGRTTSS